MIQFSERDRDSSRRVTRANGQLDLRLRMNFTSQFSRPATTMAGYNSSPASSLKFEHELGTINDSSPSIQRRPPWCQSLVMSLATKLSERPRKIVRGELRNMSIAEMDTKKVMDCWTSVFEIKTKIQQRSVPEVIVYSFPFLPSSPIFKIGLKFSR